MNRGYQKGQLREDGTLATFTGACGPCIYRGDLFPKTYQGAAFLCEPTGNLVRCNLLSEKEGVLSAENAFDKAEFLASTDERFRPVNIHNGPDGALYIVDMYRGVIQHRIYLTTYLRNQALERQLDTPLNMGRIYRVVPESYQRTQVQKLTELSTIGLVKALESPNGWRRDTAQRLLVERGDARAAEPLKQLVASSSDARARFHALWALEGLGAIDPEVLSEGLKCDHPKVRALAIRLSEPYLQAEGRTPIHDRVLAMKNDPAFDVQLQLIYSLGNVQKPGAEEVFLRLLEQNLEKELARDGAISGMAGRELRILERFVGTSGWKEKTTGREQLVRDLAQCIMVSGKPEAINSVIELAANAKSQWQQTALLDGMLAAVPPRQRNRPAQPIKPVVLPKEPTALASLLALKDKAIEERLERLDELIVWKGKKGYEVAEVQPLTKEEQELFEAGRTLYVTICGACHQPNGQGLEGLAPPLVDSEWVTGSEERLTRLVLQGVRGPITVNGKVWNMDMPPLNILDDAQLAAVMTFIRREWGHTAPPIKEDTVKRIREATIDREEAWTEAELLKIP